MQRARKLQPRRAPAHAFGDRQFVQALCHQFGQHIHGFCAGHDPGHTEARALGGVDDLQVLRRNALAGREALRRAAPVAVIVTRPGQRRPQRLPGFIGCLLHQFAHLHGQPPRRGVPAQVAKAQPALAQLALEHRAQALAECAQGTRRQLFAADFEQQRAPLHAPFSARAASTSSRSAASARGKPRAARASK